MISSAWKFWAVLPALFFVLACSEDSRTSGGIWDETQNTLAVRVLAASGEAVGNARVRLVTGTSVVEDSAISDKSGFAHLKRPSRDGFVEIDFASGVSRENIRREDSLLVDTLQKPASLRGILETRGEPLPQRLYLYGTSYFADVSADGKFSFDKIPAGEYALLAASDAEYVFWGASEAFADSARESAFAEPFADSVLVDDFEGFSGANLFHALTGASWWFTSADSFSRVTPELPANALAAEAFSGSRSVHFSFEVDSSVGAFALCGFDIGVSWWQDTTTFYDMSGMDSLTFWIRGEGHILVQFAGLLEDGNVGRWDFEFDIPSADEWRRVSIPPTGNEDWEKIKSRMRTITFLSTANADLWLDRVVFHGVSAQGIFREWLLR